MYPRPTQGLPGPLGPHFGAALLPPALLLVAALLLGALFGLSRADAANSAPVIQNQPLDRAAEEGDYVWQDQSVTGGSPMTFTWFREGVELRNLEFYNGGYSVHLTLDARTTDSGRYWYVASNAWGSATSRVAQITIRPAPPNPAYAGRRFTRIASSGVTPAGAPRPFAEPVPRAPTRWAGDRLLLSGQDSNASPLGLLEAHEGELRVRVPSGIALPNNQGTLLDAQVPEGAATTDPLLLIARVAGDAYPSAIYELQGSDTPTLVPRVDRLTPVPGAPGEQFTQLPTLLGLSPAIQHGQRVVFAADTVLRSGAYLLEGTTVRRLVDSTQPLPGAPAGHRHLRQVGFDGQLAAMVWEQEAGVGFLGLWLLDVDAAPGTAPTQVVIDPFPDGTRGLSGLDRLVVHEGSVYFTSANRTGHASVHVWRNGVVRTLLGEGSLVEAAGGMWGVDPFNLHVDQGKVFAYAFMQMENARIPVVVAPDGRTDWLLAHKIDGHRAQWQRFGASVLGVSDGRVAAWIPFEVPNPTTGLYGSLHPVLTASRTAQGTVLLHLPARTRLEQGRTTDGPWGEVVEAAAAHARARTLEFLPTFPSTFFRLVDTTGTAGE